MSDSIFIRNFDTEVNKIKEIIKSPSNVANYLENLKIIHNSIENMINQYQYTGLKSIKNELLELGISMSQIYKTTIKTDLSNHVSKFSYTLPNFKEPNLEIEMFSDDIYDILYDYVDESADINSYEGKKIIKKFYKTQNEILIELSDLRKQIKQFEQNLVDFREQQIQIIKNIILPTLYKAHMSYVKNINQNIVQINLSSEISTIVKGRQTEFIPNSLKIWLEL